MRGSVPSSAFSRIIGVAAVVCSVQVARAEPTPAEIATARRLFAESTELRSAGNWTLAASKLKEAIAIKETAGLRFHLAHCEEKLGYLVLAKRDYDRADELIRDGAQAPDVATLLAPARAELEERIPSLLVKLPPDASLARISIDGSVVETATLGTPLSLDPGPHTVAATREGRTPFTLELRLTEGEDRVIEVTFSVPPAQKTAPAPPPLPRQQPRARLAPPSSSSFGAREIVLMSEGLVALGGASVGIVFLVRRGEAGDRAAGARSAIARIGGTCAPPSSDTARYCSELDEALSARPRDATIATIGFIGAGAGVAAMAVTWLLWPKGAPAHALVLVPAPGGALVRSVF